MATGAVWWYLRAAPVYSPIMPRSRYQLRGCRHAALPRPLADGERRQAGRDAEALLRAGVGDVDAPGVDLDRDAADAGDAVHQQQRVALAGAEGGDVGARAGRRLGVHGGDDLRAVAPGRLEHRRRIDWRRPTGLSTRTTSAPHRAATSHIRSPNSPLTPTTTTSPSATVLTKAASIPADPVPDTGSVRALAVRNTVRSPLAGLVEQGEELGVEMAEERPGQRLHRLGVGVARAGAHEDAVADRHDGRR